MILTEAQKNWMIVNRQTLEAILKARIEELQDEIIMLPRGERDAKIDLVQELLMWLRDIKMLSDDQLPKKSDPVV